MLGMHNPNMHICTLGTITKGMLDNLLQIEILYIRILHTEILHIWILHIGLLHQKLLHTVIVNVCLTLWLKRVIECILHHNTQGMSHTLGEHIIPGETNLQMLNVSIAWPKVTQVMCVTIEKFISTFFLWITWRLTNLDQIRFGFKRMFDDFFFFCHLLINW